MEGRFMRLLRPEPDHADVHESHGPPERGDPSSAEPVSVDAEERRRQLGLAGPAGRPDEMDRDIAERWDLWSVQIGRVVHPTLVRLREDLPTVTSVMVCTTDGLNVCALGLDESQVERLSALATSMFATAGAATAVTRGGEEAPMPGTVSLHDGESDTVLVSIRGLVVGSLLLWVTAHDVALGGLLVRTRQTAREIADLLEADDG